MFDLPAYPGFLADISALATRYTSYDPFADVPANALGDLRQTWHAILEKLRLVSDPNLPTDRKAAWDDLLTAVDQFRGSTIWMDEAERNQSLTTPEGLKRWQLSQSCYGIYSSMETMSKRNALLPYGKEIKDYANLLQDYNEELSSFGPEFSLYRDYNTMLSALENSTHTRDNLRKQVEELDRDQDYHQDNRQALELSLVQEKGTRAELNDTYRQGLKAASDQQKKVTLIRNQVQAIKGDADSYRERTAAEKRELEEKLQLLEGQVSLLNQEVKDLRESSQLALVSGTAAQEMQTYFSQLREDVKNVPLLAITSAARHSKALQQNRGMFLDRVEKYDAACNFYDELSDAFADLRENPGQVNSVMIIGRAFYNMKEESRGNAMKLDSNRKAMETYAKYLDYKEKLRKHFLDCEPTEVERSKFDQKTESPLELLDVANQVCNIRQSMMRNFYEKEPKDDFDRDCNAAFSEIEGNYLKMKANIAKQREGEKLLRSKELQVDDLNTKIASIEQDIQMHEAVIQQHAIETDVTPLLEQQAKEELLLDDLNCKNEALEKSIQESDKKIDQYLTKLDRWDRLQTARKRLPEAQKTVEKLSGMVNQVHDFYLRHNQLVEKGAELNQTLDVDDTGKLGNKLCDKNRNMIHRGLQHFKDTAEIGRQYTSDHRHYRLMRGAIDNLLKDDGAALQDKSPEQLRDLLGEVKASANAYLTAKKKQWFRWRPSIQRKTRLAYAEELVRWCDDQIGQLDGTKSQMEALQKSYDTSAAPSIREKKPFENSGEAMLRAILPEAKKKILSKSANGSNAPHTSLGQPSLNNGNAPSLSHS